MTIVWIFLSLSVSSVGVIAWQCLPNLSGMDMSSTALFSQLKTFLTIVFLFDGHPQMKSVIIALTIAAASAFAPVQVPRTVGTQLFMEYGQMDGKLW